MIIFRHRVRWTGGTAAAILAVKPQRRGDRVVIDVKNASTEHDAERADVGRQGPLSWDRKANKRRCHEQ